MKKSICKIILIILFEIIMLSILPNIVKGIELIEYCDSYQLIHEDMGNSLSCRFVGSDPEHWMEQCTVDGTSVRPGVFFGKARVNYKSNGFLANKDFLIYDLKRMKLYRIENLENLTDEKAKKYSKLPIYSLLISDYIVENKDKSDDYKKIFEAFDNGIKLNIDWRDYDNSGKLDIFESTDGVSGGEISDRSVSASKYGAVQLNSYITKSKIKKEITDDNWKNEFKRYRIYTQKRRNIYHNLFYNIFL